MDLENGWMGGHGLSDKNRLKEHIEFLHIFKLFLVY